MTPSIKCSSCTGTGISKRRRICWCVFPCKKCGGTERAIHGGCRSCLAKGTKKHRQKIIVEQTDCVTCHTNNHSKSGDCLTCRQRCLTAKLTTLCVICGKCDWNTIGCCRSCKRERKIIKAVCGTCGMSNWYDCGDCRNCREQNRTSNWFKYLLASSQRTSRTRKHNRPTITWEWIQSQFIEQQGMCYYTKQLLQPNMLGTRSLLQPSLDRIDNTIGYVPENVRLTSLGWNQLRNNSSIEDTLTFIEQCQIKIWKQT